MSEMTPLELYEKTKEIINEDIFKRKVWSILENTTSVELLRLNTHMECIEALLNSIAGSLAVIAEDNYDNLLNSIADSLDTIARSTRDD